MVENNSEINVSAFGANGHVVRIENEILFPIRGEATVTRSEAEDLRDDGHE